MHSKELVRVIFLTPHFQQSASFAIAVTCLYVFIFTFSVLYSTCVHVCIYVHINGHVYLHFLYCVLHVYVYVYIAIEEHAAFWLNGHWYDIDIDIDMSKSSGYGNKVASTILQTGFTTVVNGDWYCNATVHTKSSILQLVDLHF